MVRLQDIADMVGVSRTTVSNVLHGNTKRVSPETIQKITEILKQAEYVPNMGSLLLTGNHSKLIGLVIGYGKAHGQIAIGDSFVSEMTGLLHEIVEKHGYYLMLIGGENQENVINIASRWNVDGLILFAYSEENYRKLVKKLNKPMVTIDAYPEKHQDMINVGIDDLGGGYLAGRHLLEMGHPDPLYLAENKENADAQRWLGMKKALEEQGITCDEERRVILSHYEKVRLCAYQEMMPRLLQSGALFFAADYLAVEFMNECFDRGIKVPEQISVVGFDDTMLARIVRPKLTTIRQSNRNKVTLAFERLLRVMNNEKMEEKDMRLPVELVVRDSVKRRKR